MIELKDLETDAGNAEFASCRESVKRYARSRGFSEEDAEEIAQETCTRVIQKMTGNEVSQVNGGYFIRIADFIFLEQKRKYAIHRKFFFSPHADDNEIEQPLDSQSQVARFQDESGRAMLNDCFLECFGERSDAEQILLWQYSFDEKFAIDREEPYSYGNFLGAILDSIREARKLFFSMPSELNPLTRDVRIKVFRLREKLRKCLGNCLSRKKGFG